MRIRGTHTFALLAVTKSTYNEIKSKLEAAEYHHAFVDDTIDMHGIGLCLLDEEKAEKVISEGTVIPDDGSDV